MQLDKTENFEISDPEKFRELAEKIRLSFNDVEMKKNINNSAVNEALEVFERVFRNEEKVKEKAG